MRLALDVNYHDVSPRLWIVLGIIATEYRRTTEAPIVVTSMRRDHDAERSRHSPGLGVLCTAFDFSRRELDAHGLTAAFVQMLRGQLEPNVQLVIEPEELTEPLRSQVLARPDFGPHIHVQLAEDAWPMMP